MAYIVAIGPSMISAGPPTGHPRAEKLEPPLAPIANQPNSTQPGGIPYHSAKLHPGPCNSVGMRPRTDRHTDVCDHNTFLVVYDSREM